MYLSLLIYILQIPLSSLSDLLNIRIALTADKPNQRALDSAVMILCKIMCFAIDSSDSDWVHTTLCSPNTLNMSPSILHLQPIMNIGEELGSLWVEMDTVETISYHTRNPRHTTCMPGQYRHQNATKCTPSPSSNCFLTECQVPHIGWSGEPTHAPLHVIT